ncbi:heme-degrading domain-containing protein [Pseudoclavibacter sp. RFBG4]|uniref:heme-degrading domain-containing protein n=1 Tax=Pseudoclavibacter sp. RFBG4 TaxID=2080575 RepID=UPI000CE75DC3|nr:heme-degrading domain-containing protein [Pseudoclavibacter sp. RFBG4]PPG27336.1 heme-degrading domain-containing protein [Pseudoclavibacter sp. RFBG4]
MSSAPTPPYVGLPVDDILQLLRAEERELDFPSFTLEDAWQVGTWLRHESLVRGHSVAVSIVLGGQRAFHAATPGSAVLNDAWLARKFRVVEHFGHSTLAVRYTYQANGEDFAADSLLDPREYAAAGGAFPIRIGGTLAGAVGVSGLEMHEDHALVVEALRVHQVLS